MPELPEVEEVRRTLEPFLLNVPIAQVRVEREDFVKPAGAPLQRLVGRRFVRTMRQGKKLFCIADDGQTLLIHLGMSGRVDCVVAATAIAKHTHVVFALASGTHMRLRDPRRFGGAWYYATLEEALAKETSALGRDALAISTADLAHWRSAKGRLKVRLLAQRDVAGLGNIYVDEALWAARLHPCQLVGRIPQQRLAALVQAIRKVLAKSIASGGTTLRDYRNVADQPGRFAQKLCAYGRAGRPCLRCRTALRATRVAGRTTVYCPVCQRCR